MPRKTEMIHKGRFYQACFVDCQKHGGLIVSRTRKPGGVIFPASSPDCKIWVDAIREAIDHDEAEALCRAIYQGV